VARFKKFQFDDFNVHGIQENRGDEIIPVLAGAGIRE